MTPSEHAELALLLEVAGAPKPGNVDRERDLADLRFEQFLAGAVGAREGLELAAEPDERLGAAFETAVAGMAAASDTNTQFGCLLLVTPLVRTAATGDLTRERASEVTEATTVADAAGFYRAFEHTDVAVGDPPEGAADLDVRRGAAAVPALRERDLTLHDVMELSADGDANAREWTTGFSRVFDAAERIAAGDGPLTDRAADAFLRLLAEEPDTLVVTEHGDATAEAVRSEAERLIEAPDADIREFADDLVERGVNPGTTADLTAAALFVALESGASVAGVSTDGTASGGDGGGGQ
ncbi:triphosphoribosyl-dephospho-CoA synthase [Halobacterium jilantaiense]|uniref:Triphosphoribosyl-dephospho-CoA synthase n=1 Tax=Halobacterium jilantaiense TaxID=355548 RepID=A0A1I0QPQ0_9EURY|nr:triphosphoribosyl-dephospho-CoA synthase [Halobacterium jilantaiense]SEW29167.1 triphosphoribosyl-dephospho-CoA synthase [Halobacterium jilantaiense]